MAPPSGPITLGGRQFAPPEQLTFAQHAYTMDIVYAAGLHEPGSDLARFIMRVFGTGKVPELLAGLYVEVGQRWTRNGAHANAAFFCDLTEPGEILTLGNLIAEELLRFFLSARRSSAPSPSCSTAPPAPSGVTAATSTAATGASSFATSPATTPTASSRS